MVYLLDIVLIRVLNIIIINERLNTILMLAKNYVVPNVVNIISNVVVVM